MDTHAALLFDSVAGGAYRDGQARLFRRNVLVAASVYMAFVCWDVIVAPESLKDTFGIRMLMLGVCTLLFLVSGLPSFRRWYNWYYVALVASGGLSVGAILWLVPNGFAIGITGVALCITASSALFRANAGATASAGAIVTIGTAALMVLHGEPDYLVRGHVIFLVCAAGFAVLHSAQAERTAGEVYGAQENLRGEKLRTESLLQDLTSIREERMTWLENLATFLRHELKNQLVAVRTSIDLARDEESLQETHIYLSRAQRSLDRMRELVSSATEATSLEAALAVDETECVDLSDVVVDRVCAFQQLGPSRHVTLNVRPGFWVDGNAERLTQLLDKLLANAFEHSPEDAEVQVALRRMPDGWLELAVENEGDALPEDKERIFEAFVTSQKHGENLGLGLFVARSIARMHGGHVTAEDLSSGTGARFVVRLPEKGANVLYISDEEAEKLRRPIPIPGQAVKLPD